MFFRSVMAQTQRRRRAVTTTWSRMPPARVRCGAGKVPKMLAVSGVVLYQCCHKLFELLEYLNSLD